MAHFLNSTQKTALTDYKLDRRSFTPLYQQIKDLLLAQINRGELSAGDVIPSETRLAAALQVSRLTVRQALYELRIEGYVIREKGRGTFIARTAVPVRIL